MKLNNKGWGVFQMAWMTGIILFFFLLTIILITKYYHERNYVLIDKSPVVEWGREDMVKDLEKAAIRYFDHYYANIDNVGSTRLTDDRLFQVGLFPKDLYGDCDGYAIAKKTNGVISADAYINCDDYKSPGYDKN